MNGGSAAKIRLVRCPKCWNVLVEPQDIPVYPCGGCSTYLRAKIRKSNPEVATSGLHETYADQKYTSAGEDEMMMVHQREDLSLEDCRITAEDMEIGSFHERPSFNQADEPRGDPSQPTNDQLYSSSGQRRKTIEMARLKSRWTLLMTNLILEIASAVFDQLGDALVGMVLAFVALLLSTAELIYMARKERMRRLGTLAPGKPVCTIVEYFGLVGAVWQCFYSTVEYAYARQKKDNPIKMCLLPFIFLLCVVISNLLK